MIEANKERAAGKGPAMTIDWNAPTIEIARAIISNHYGPTRYADLPRSIMPGNGPVRVEAIKSGKGDDYWEVRVVVAAIEEALSNRQPAPQYPAELVERAFALIGSMCRAGCHGDEAECFAEARAILALLPQPADPDEAMERLLSIRADEDGYGGAVLEVYGTLPKGQFYRDLAAIKRVRAEKG